MKQSTMNCRSYEGRITNKMGDGYEVYYPDYQQHDVLSCEELKDLICTKKIVFVESNL
jgi:hypothetical protein